MSCNKLRLRHQSQVSELSEPRQSFGKNSSVEQTASNLADAPHPRMRAWWKWSLALTLLLLIFLAWQCGSALRHGRALADPAVAEFHKKMNAGQYWDICRNADPSLCGIEKRDEFVQFLEGVHAKLGDAGATNQLNMTVNTTLLGSSVVAQYETTCTRGTATETFTWNREGGLLKLSGYQVQSNAFLKK
jgi:hypothetical protein